jgi:hypothetical protein
VIEKHKSLGFRAPVLAEVAQCAVVTERLANFAGEGCNFVAEFRAVRAEGEFHIAPGLSWFHQGWHVHDVTPFGMDFGSLNLTHTIDRLQFSRRNEKMPLDGQTLVQRASGSWKAIYTADILGDNFSISRYTIDNETSGSGGSPALVFRYDVSPITATTYLDREPAMHLLTRLLIVIGGVLALFRLLDGVVFRTGRRKRPAKIEE